jgi:hypothetical protein
MVDFYFDDVPYGRKHKNKISICFTECSSASNIKGKYITYVLGKNLAVTNEEIYKYLLFLRKIPEFKPWLPKPQELMEKKEICFSCEENNIGVFLGLTLFRAIEEFPSLVKEIANLKNIKYNLSNLTILRLISNSTHINNTDHWIIGTLKNTNKENLEKPLNNTVLESARPFKEGIEYKLYKFMNYDSFAESVTQNNNEKISHIDAYKKWKKELK